jgi:hypothetical protein
LANVKRIFQSRFKKVFKLLNNLSGWWVGFGCGWAKLNMVQKHGLCVSACTSFNFAKGWHFVWHFSVRLFVVVSSFKVAAKGKGFALVGI